MTEPKISPGADCQRYAGSRKACEDQKTCRYREGGLLQAAVCYNPQTEVPGYVWGVWPLHPRYERAVGLRVRRELEHLDPLPGTDFNQLAARTTQREPVPLNAEQQTAVERMRAEGERVYAKLRARRRAFSEPDATMGAVELTPGDQIYRTGAFGLAALEHHGIYIGDGFVVEVGGGGVPAVIGLQQAFCALDVLTPPAPGIVGLSTLEQFMENRNAAYGRVDYRERDRRPRAATVADAVDLIGAWNYKVNASNCEHFATYLVTGEWRSRQMERIRKFLRRTVLKPLDVGLALGRTSMESVRSAAVLSGASGEQQNDRTQPDNNISRQSACTLQANGSCAFENVPHCPTLPVVSLECAGGARSCYRLPDLARELRRQRRAREPFHDPETGLLLTALQAQIVLRNSRKCTTT